MGTSTTKGNLVESLKEKGVSVERVNVAMKNTGLDLFRKCLCQEWAGTVHTKNSVAMLVS